LVSLLLLLTAIPVLSIFPAQVEAGFKPTLTLSPMAPSSYEVNVTPSSIGSANFSFYVNVTKTASVGTVMVTLDGSTSTGWPTLVSPGSIAFTSSGSVQANVTVTVPQASPASSIGKVQVEALGTYPGGSVVAQTSATVTLAQYFRWNLVTQKHETNSTNLGLSMDVYNRGNGLDVFEVNIINLKELLGSGFEFDTGTITTPIIVQDEYYEVVFNVTATGSIPQTRFFHEAQVRVTSLEAQNSGWTPTYTEYNVVLVFNLTPKQMPVNDTVPYVFPSRQTSSTGSIPNYLIPGAIIIIVIILLALPTKRRKR
jgi:hypothetical protein